MEFEWDEDKNERNRRRHGLSFEEAALVFLDPLQEVIFDDRDDYGEERLTVFGMVDGLLLAVTYTMRGETTRLISARKATRHERKRYEDHEI